MSKKQQWMTLFEQQVAYGRRWKEIFKDQHDSSLFLDRSDAVAIIKRGQLDVYDELIDELGTDTSVEAASIVVHIKSKRAELALSDLSGLGMRGLDIEALRAKFDKILDDLSPTEMYEWLEEYRRKNDTKTP